MTISPERSRATAAALRAAYHASLSWFAEPAAVADPYAWYLLVASDLEETPPTAGWDYPMLFSAAAALISFPGREAFAAEILTIIRLVCQHPDSLAPPGALPPMLIDVFEQYLTPRDAWLLPLILPLAAATPQNKGAAGDAQIAAFSLLGLVGNSGDPLVTAPLLAALQERRRGKAAVAGRALGELGVAEATDLLIRWLERTRGEEFVEALGLLRAAQALDPLLGALRALQRYRRPRFRSIANALACIGDLRAADALRPYLEHPTLSVSAAVALSRLGVDGTVEQIAASALDPLDPSWESARRLVELDDPRGLSAMQQIYQTRWNGVRPMPSGKADRAALLRDLSRHGVGADIPVLEWVREHDGEPTDQGWCLAEEAGRTIARIQARHAARPHL